IPAWLRRRIERARAARQLVGEEVSEAENARDQIVAFSTWFGRHAEMAASWAEPPRLPDLPTALDQLESLLAGVDPRGN
ncbi:MAG: nucleotidyltransferase domain-containing protein, partial [Candidatus Dormibacteraeota bacterium]|nr:nucleotidyltransferase domain-containing protein [Candidatus Dormibacteraeota bacterium]